MSRRVRQRRITAGLSREALAAKAGVSRDTVKRFELTGQGTVESLLRIAFALGTLHEWDTLFAEPAVAGLSLDALEDSRALAALARAPRQRARRADASGATVAIHVLRAASDASRGARSEHRDSTSVARRGPRDTKS
jgi:transcriptional regulator with XRE-family HTH domain